MGSGSGSGFFRESARDYATRDMSSVRVGNFFPNFLCFIHHHHSNELYSELYSNQGPNIN